MRLFLQPAALLWALAACLPGCAASTRRDAGTVVAAAGGFTALVGAGVALGCSPFESESDDASGTSSCETDDMEPNPEVGLPMIGIGLGLAMIGAVVYGTGVPAAAAPPPASDDAPAPSEHLY